MSQASLPDLRPMSSPALAPGWRLWGVRHLADRIGVCECRRRLLHMLPGLLPAIVYVIPHRDPWGFPLIAGVIMLTVGVVALAFIRQSDFARPNETLWHHSVMGYMIPVIAMLLLLPGHAELGLMTLGVLAFGDGSAALGGKVLQGRRLPWNRNKTWAGLTCFAVMGTLAASLSYWSEANPVVPYQIAFIIGGAAAAAGAVVESLPIRSHDNFRVGATAAVTGLLMQSLLLGW